MERRQEQQIKRMRAQSITLENREMLTVSGVRSVVEFNEADITLETDCGILHVDGDSLHITRLNLEDGIVLAEGMICGIVFDDEMPESSQGGFFSRLFR